MLLKDKKALITGIGNERSISYEIAKKSKEQGAELILTYHPVMKSRVEEIARELKATAIIELDASKEESFDTCFEELGKYWSNYDLLLHGIAFSNKDNLSGKYYNFTKEDFHLAMDISVYSFTNLMKRSKDLLNENGSALTLTYLGAEKVITNYNIMGIAKAALEASVRYLAVDFGDKGIRVNSISSGPIKTLASSAIREFNKVLRSVEINAPLKRNVSQEDVAKTALYLFSDLSSGVTAQNIYVDSGYSSVVSTKNE